MVVITFINIILACSLPFTFADSPLPPEPPKHPLTKTTDDGAYTVTISWEPSDPIEAYPHYNVTTTFLISIFDSNGIIPTNIDYSVSIKDIDSTSIKEWNSADTDQNGYSKPLDVQFRERGISHVIVCIPSESSSIRNSCADFAIIVVPEFPATAAILVLAATISLATVFRLKPIFKA